MLQSCVQSSIDENNRHGMVIFMLIFDKAFLVGAVMTPVRDRYTPAIAMVAALLQVVRIEDGPRALERLANQGSDARCPRWLRTLTYSTEPDAFSAPSARSPPSPRSASRKRG